MSAAAIKPELVTILKAASVSAWPPSSREQLKQTLPALNKNDNNLLRQVRLENNTALKHNLAYQLESVRIAIALVLSEINKEESEPYCFYSTVLTSLLNDKSGIEKGRLAAEINTLFIEFKNYDVKKAADFAAQHQQKLEKSCPIIGVNRHLDDFTKKLSNQVSAQGIFPLLPVYMDEPLQFAALLLWLINKNVTPQEILRSHLLHDFIACHFWSIDADENDVKSLYSALETINDNSAVITLIKKAKETSCGQRGFLNRSLSNNVDKADLPLIPRVHSTFNLTVSEANIENLSQCFAATFWECVLNKLAEQKDPELERICRNFFNSSEIFFNQLPDFINGISKQDEGKKTKLLKSMADLLTDDTVSRALKINSNTIYLLPYKNSLISDIKPADLENQLTHISQCCPDYFEEVSQTMALFNLLYQNGKFSQEYLFEKILDMLLAKPDVVLNDDALILKIQKDYDTYNYKILSSRCVLSLVNRALDISSSLGRCLEENTKQPLTLNNYQKIEDCWRENSGKMQLLIRIGSVRGYFPTDKYALKNWVIHRCHQLPKFDVIATIDIMTNDYLNNEIRREEIERTCIEILLYDHPDDLKKIIIDYLENNLQIRQWPKKIYGSGNLLTRAINERQLKLVNLLINLPEQFDETEILAQINEGLLNKKFSELDLVERLAAVDSPINQTIILKFPVHTTKLLMQGRLNSTIATVALVAAIKANNQTDFNNIYNLTGENKPDSAGINAAFIAAAEAGYLAIVENIGKRITDQLTIDEAFLATSNSGIVKWLINNHNLNQSVVGKKLFLAAGQGNINSVKLLCELTGDNRPSKTGTADALLNAARHLQFLVVRELCSLEGDSKPASENVADALVAAVIPFGLDTVKELSGLTGTSKASQAKICEALIAAVHANQSDIFEHLSCLTSDNKPTAETIAEALLIAAKLPCLEMVQALSKQSDVYKQVEDVIPTALNDTSCWKIAQWLCNEKNVAQQVVDNILLRAADKGDISFVRAVCNPNNKSKPTITGVSQALNAAAFNSCFDVVKALCTITGSNKPNEAAIFAALVITPEGEIAEWLCHGQSEQITKWLCSEKNSDQRVIDDVLLRVASKGNISLVSAICNPDNKHKPTAKGVAQALIAAANKQKLDVIKELCGMTGNNKPDESAISQALDITSDWEIVEWICREQKLDQDSINKVLLAAVNAGRINIIKLLCGSIANNKPSAGVIKECLTVASAKGKLSVVKELCNMTGDNKPDEVTLLKAQEGTNPDIKARLQQQLDHHNTIRNNTLFKPAIEIPAKYVKPKEIAPCQLNLNTIQYDYGSTGSRWHLFAAKASADMKVEYKNLEGDVLKRAILDSFRTSLVNTTDVNDLARKIGNFKRQEEYTILATGQGFVTWFFDRKTDSMKEFERICDEAGTKISPGL